MQQREKARGIAIDSPRTDTVDPGERFDGLHLAAHHARQVLVGEHRVLRNSLGVGDALAQLAQPGEDGEIGFAEHFAIIDPAAACLVGLQCFRQRTGAVGDADADRPERRLVVGDEMPLDSEHAARGEQGIEFGLGRQGVAGGDGEETQTHR